jgi:hypothetical protein
VKRFGSRILRRDRVENDVFGGLVGTSASESGVTVTAVNSCRIDDPDISKLWK